MKKSIYTRITLEIVADLEHGVAPWVRPWGGTASALPHNAATGHCYRGINHVLLGMRCYAQGFASNGWITFRQATKLGGSVRRGERGTSVVYYQPIDPKADNEGSVSSVGRSRALFRVFTVFNLDQVEGPSSRMSRGISHGSRTQLPMTSSNGQVLISATRAVRRSMRRK